MTRCCEILAHTSQMLALILTTKRTPNADGSDALCSDLRPDQAGLNDTSSTQQIAVHTS